MQGVGRWRNLKQRLGFKGIGCCGRSWGFGAPTQMNVRDEAEEEDEEERGRNVVCVGVMNLATALAAERNNSRGEKMEKSLMRMLEEVEVDEDDEEEGVVEEEGEEGGGLLCCCVCMERTKGAAFIPCGHTYCRVCSRELWLNRGSCPLCNHSIVDVLNIF